MSDPSFGLWVYLSRTPLLWLTVTLLAYAAADRFSARTGRHPLANPVLHAVWIMAAILWLTGTRYRTYFDGAQFVHFLLGPATVALAIPLYEHRRLVLRSLVPMGLSLLAGSLTALTSAILIASFLGAPPAVLVSLAPKSVTAGVAMGITEALGGDPALTAVLVILTGILGAIVVTPLRTFCASATGAPAASRPVSRRTGSAPRAFQVNPVAGTFAGIAMGLNALVTALLLPLVLRILSP